jgi:hypothetical protein
MGMAVKLRFSPMLGGDRWAGADELFAWSNELNTYTTT